MNSYRNIYYDNQKGEIVLFTWSSSGKRIKEIVPFEPYLYLESQSYNDATSIYGTQLRKMSFRRQWDRHQFIQGSSINRIFFNLPVDQQFLIENFRQYNETLEFSKNPLKIFFLDIEIHPRRFFDERQVKIRSTVADLETETTIVGDLVDRKNKDNHEVWDEEKAKWMPIMESCYLQSEFPDPQKADYPINLITLYDSISNEFITWGLKNDYVPTQPNSKYIKCLTEKELLLSFLEYWKEDYPDLVSGWNSNGFDLPYIINRITNLFDSARAHELSPVGKIWYREAVSMQFGKMVGKWVIKGISLLDYMEVYQIFSRTKQESYSLGNIAEAELKTGKTKPPLRIDVKNWDKFVEYNINDVVLLVGLEHKLQFLALVRMLAYTGLTNFEQALGTITIVTGAMAIKGLERNQIISTFSHKDSGAYLGGYVREPEKGLQESIVSFDVNSLYPNTIVTLNLSPETKLGKVNSRENGNVSLSLLNGKTHELTEEQFQKILVDKKIALSKSNILFSQKKIGICPSFIDGLYKKRAVAQKRLKTLKKKMAGIKDKTLQEYKDLDFEAGQLDIRQYVLKIFMNRVYGCFGVKYSPFYDLDLASSITLTGQECIKYAGRIVNEYFNRKYDTKEDFIVAGDTDSLFLTIHPILKKLGILLVENETKITEEVHDIVNELEEHLNKQINSWAINELSTVDPRLNFKREAICDVGIFITKKRYILHILDEEGIPQNKTKYVGVEVASTNIPKKVKSLIKKVVETIIKTKSQTETNKTYKQIYEDFKGLKIEEIAFPKGINNVDKYSKISSNLNFGKGTPCHVKASLGYNHLLNKFQLTNKYEKIYSGNKIKFFYTLKNPWNLDVIAFIDQYPTEFNQLIPDTDKMFEKSVGAAVKRLYDVVNWKVVPPNRAPQTDLFELFGV